MRWWGLYTQRKQGVPGERTGSAEPEELEDEFFMMRIRIDGGGHDERPAPRDRLGERAVRTRRRRRDRPPERAAALDPHRRRAGDLGAHRVGRPLDAGGLRRHASRDPRCPLAGVTADEVFDATPRHPGGRRPIHRRPGVLEPAAQVQDVDQRLPSPAARTTRSTTSRSWASIAPVASSATTCRSAAGSRRTRCSRSGSAPSCARERVPEVWAGVTGLFREYGYRRSATTRGSSSW